MWCSCRGKQKVKSHFSSNEEDERLQMNPSGSFVSWSCGLVNFFICRSSFFPGVCLPLFWLRHVSGTRSNVQTLLSTVGLGRLSPSSPHLRVIGSMKEDESWAMNGGPSPLSFSRHALSEHQLSLPAMPWLFSPPPTSSCGRLRPILHPVGR